RKSSSHHGRTATTLQIVSSCSALAGGRTRKPSRGGKRRSWQRISRKFYLGRSLRIFLLERGSLLPDILRAREERRLLGRYWRLFEEGGLFYFFFLSCVP